jgi:hypothetical protein
LRRRRPGRALAVALAAALAAAASPGCASTDDSLPPAYVPASAADKGKSARALASELGLAVRADPAVGTLALEGEAGRIVLVGGTSTITVAGRVFQAAEPLRIDGGDCLLVPADAVRLSEAWHAALKDIEDAAGPPPAPPAAPRPPSGPAVGAGDPEWRVPLRRKWEGILLHHSATDSGSLAKFDKHHREVNGWLMVGYDFIIGNGRGSGDGVVETSDRWRRQIQGAHAGTGLKRYNEHWVGICLVGDFNGERPTPRQIASLRRLVAFLRAYCDIPEGNVLGHRDVRVGGTDCPGRFFPSDESSILAPRAR